MENKYYKPKLDEIYWSPEIHYCKDGKVNKNAFVDPYQYRDENKVICMWDEINIDNCRIKYLDKDDIESFGFKIDSSGERYYELGDNQLYYQDENNYLYIIDSEGYLFKGFIKNKSELGVLLRQLNIVNDGI